MAYQNLEPISKQVTILIGLTVVGFMSFGLALSYYTNVLFEQTVENIKEQNNNLRENIKKGYRDLEYFKSSQYKDKYAKENLGLVNPGEKVLIIQQPLAVASIDKKEGEMQKEQQQAAFLELLRQMPIIEHWKLYLFEREKLQELMNGV